MASSRHKPKPGSEPGSDISRDFQPEKTRIGGFNSSLGRELPEVFKQPFSFGGYTYEAQRKLGAGGIGTVFLAIRSKEHSNEEVAVKLIETDEEHIEYVLREISAYSSLSKVPNVVTLLDHAQLGPYTICVVTELLEGMDLEQLIESRTSCDIPFLTWGEAKNVILPACKALDAAHKITLVHRDIKPSNIFAAGDPEDLENLEEGIVTIKVLDFGLALGFGDVREEKGIVVGTPHFMSPEQAKGDTSLVDHRTDIFSIGSTLFYLLTGHAPFGGASYEQIMVNVMAQSAPLHLLACNNTLPEAFPAVLGVALEKDPDNRFQSMRQLMAAIRSCNGNGVYSLQDSSSPPPTRAPEEFDEIPEDEDVTYHDTDEPLSLEIIGDDEPTQGDSPASKLGKQVTLPGDHDTDFGGETIVDSVETERKQVNLPLIVGLGAVPVLALALGVGAWLGWSSPEPSNNRPDPAPVVRTEPVKQPPTKVLPRPPTEPMIEGLAKVPDGSPSVTLNPDLTLNDGKQDGGTVGPDPINTHKLTIKTLVGSKTVSDISVFSKGTVLGKTVDGMLDIELQGEDEVELVFRGKGISTKRLNVVPGKTASLDVVLFLSRRRNGSSGEGPSKGSGPRDPNKAEQKAPPVLTAEDLISPSPKGPSKAKTPVLRPEDIL